MIKKIAAAAILMCAVMVLVAGAPLVIADTHHIVKGAQGPRASAMSWIYTPSDTGVWNGHIVNSGLRSLVVDVEDITTGAATSILHQRIRFAAYPSDTLDTLGVLVSKTHKYNITATPNGPKGTSCMVDDVLTVTPSPVAAFTSIMNGATVTVDGSGSSDPNAGATITNWGWEWGDGSAISTGMTASHTYAKSGTYTITLTVLSSTGMTDSVSHDVVVDTPPVAMFTYTTTTSGTVSVDASASTDDHGIVSYAWNWGDSMTGTGVAATHTYATSGAYTITLTVTDTIGQTNSLSKSVSVDIDLPPVAAFTPLSNALTVSVNASASSDDHVIVSYAWNWGDLTTGTGVAATHTYGAGGTYTITLTVTDTIGQTNSVSHDVIVKDIPPVVASFTATVSGAMVSVDASASTPSANIVSYDWNWGDSIIGPSGVTASHTYFPPGGTFTITLTVTDTFGQKGTASKTVTVVNTIVPPPPFLLYGMTWASDGVTPLAGCTVTVTDVRTGTTLIGIVSDGTGAYYVMDLNPMYQLAGDTLIVNAIGPAGETGSGTGVVGGDPYLGIDVTLTMPSIPEFTDLVIPIAGMISIFAVARVASSRKEEE